MSEHCVCPRGRDPNALGNAAPARLGRLGNPFSGKIDMSFWLFRGSSNFIWYTSMTEVDAVPAYRAITTNLVRYQEDELRRERKLSSSSVV